MKWMNANKLAFTKLLSEFDKQNIRYVVLRNFEGLPDTINSRDIDLVVEPGYWKQACNYIESNYKTLGAYAHRVVKLYGVNCYTLFFEEYGMDISLRVDIEMPIDYRGTQLVDFDYIYNHSYNYHGINVADEYIQALIVLLTTYKTASKPKDKYLILLNKLSEEYLKDFDEYCTRLFGKKNCEVIKSDVSNSYLHSRSIWKYFILHNHIQLKGLCRYIKASFNKPKSGLVFSVHGPDGVGKTTFINEFEKELMALFSIEAEGIEYYHFRPNVFPNIKKLLTGKELSDEEISNPHLKEPSSKPVSFVRCIYYWLDYVLGYKIKVLPKIKRDCHVIFDRYFVDLLADPGRARISLPEKVLMFLYRMVPKVNIAFYLVCDSDTIYSRKKELDLPEIERQLEAYKQYSNMFENSVVIDASKTVEIMTRKAIHELIVRTYK